MSVYCKKGGGGCGFSVAEISYVTQSHLGLTNSNYIINLFTSSYWYPGICKIVFTNLSNTIPANVWIRLVILVGEGGVVLVLVDQ
jgi:hypothetical protein